jgi:hypothetical protein
MKKIASVTLLILCSVAGLHAQTYDCVRSVGDHDFLFSFRQSAQQAFSPPKDNELSTWQALPFPWKFFGKDVSGYAISDNGYITFDREARTSVAANTTLPDAAAPRNCIFAFWTDLRMEAGHGQWANSVWTATIGQAPNRVHLIYWMSVVPAPDSFANAGYNFALAVYENGEFEVIFTSGRKATPVKATVGALNADGKQAVLAAGPAFDFPSVGYGGDDDINYRFKPKPAAASGPAGWSPLRWPASRVP